MFRRVLLGLTFGFALCGAALADAQFTSYGTTAGGGIFNRPGTLSALSLAGTAVRYSVVGFYPNEDTNCTIYSTQEGGAYDGHIALYQNSFNPASPLTNLVALNDDFHAVDGGYELGTSRIPSIPLTFVANWYLVVSGYENDDIGSYSVNIVCDDPATRVLPASDYFLANNDGEIHALKAGRFEVSATWTNFSSISGDGTFVPVGSDDSGLIWFFQPGNWEVLIKIIDGCSLNNRYWVFAAATTNVRYTLTVRDTGTTPATVWSYTNPLGNTSPAVTDTSAFATCP